MFKANSQESQTLVAPAVGTGSAPYHRNSIKLHRHWPIAVSALIR